MRWVTSESKRDEVWKYLRLFQKKDAESESFHVCSEVISQLAFAKNKMGNYLSLTKYRSATVL